MRAGQRVGEPTKGSRLAGASPPLAVSVLPPDRSQDSALQRTEVMNMRRTGTFFPSGISEVFYKTIFYFPWVPARWEEWVLGT